MIVKRVPMRDPVKSTFAGLVAYVTDTQGKTQRVGEVRYTNLHNEDPVVAAMEVANVQARNTRATSDKNYHLLISFAPGESPSPEALRAIEDRLCESIGYADHQRVSAVHRDTDCLHIHIAINKIHPVRFTIHEPFYDKKTLGKVAEELEVEYGLQRVDHTGRKSASQNRAEDMERHSGVQSLLGWIKAECLDEFRASQSWADLHAAMQANGLQLRPQGNGLVIHDGEGTMVKASSVARDLSLAQLENRLGTFQPSAEEGARAPARKRYEARPTRVRVDTASLYAVYKDEQEDATAARSGAMASERVRYRDQIEAAKRAGRLRRATIKLLGESPANKRLLYALASKSLRDSIKKARDENQEAKRRITERHSRRAWADWLRSQAAGGNAEALKALRAREVSQGLKGETLEALGDASGFKDAAIQDGVTKQGTVIYRGAGGAAIRDDGKRIQVSSGAKPAGMAQALQMAAARYGSRIFINGSATFREQAVRAAAAARLPVTFTDAALEARRAALVQFLNQREKSDDHLRRNGAGAGTVGVGRSAASVGGTASLGTGQPADSIDATGAALVAGANSPRRTAGSAKPNIGRVGKKPPATNKNRLRDLSELAVVHVPAGSPVLLPSDVPHHVEHEEAKPDNRVRREMDRGRVGGRPQDLAVEKYIAEREAKRLKGINIPKHVRYTDGSGAAAYAGTRTSDGTTLALMKQGDEIVVLAIDAATAQRLKRIKVGDPLFLTPEGTIRTKGRSR